MPIFGLHIRTEFNQFDDDFFLIAERSMMDRRQHVFVMFISGYNVDGSFFFRLVYISFLICFASLHCIIPINDNNARTKNGPNFWSL